MIFLLKLQVEGSSDLIQSFMYELNRNPSMVLHQQENSYKVKYGKIESCTKCLINHNPQSRVRMIEILTTDGKTIRIEMLDMIQAEVNESVKVFTGKTIDIFQ